MNTITVEQAKQGYHKALLDAACEVSAIVFDYIECMVEDETLKLNEIQDLILLRQTMFVEL